MYSKVTGTLLGVTEKKPREGKPYKILQVLTKSGNRFDIVNVKAFNGFRGEINKTVDLDVFITASIWKGNAFLNVSLVE